MSNQAPTSNQTPTSREAPTSNEAVPVRIGLLGRPGCHLCDDARAVVTKVADELGVGWAERDITTAPPQEQADYWDKIPVAFVDGIVIDFWRINEGRLRSALAGTRPGTKPGTTSGNS